MGCPGKWWSHCPWGCLKDVQIKHLGAWFSGGLGSAGLMVGLGDLKGPFNPSGCMIEWEPCAVSVSSEVFLNEYTFKSQILLMFHPSTPPSLCSHHFFSVQWYSPDITALFTQYRFTWWAELSRRTPPGTAHPPALLSEEARLLPASFAPFVSF